jgi:hypothetical protein
MGGFGGIDDIRGIHAETVSTLGSRGISGYACTVLKDWVATVVG